MWSAAQVQPVDSERKSEERGVAIGDTSFSSSMASMMQQDKAYIHPILVASESEHEDVCEYGFRGFDSVSVPRNEEHFTRYPICKRVPNIIAHVQCISEYLM
ncbi:hypothetical protein PR048_016355 [Dryococelus australis]|uniref:Uncharacterized protein n=1 Tax=Dryococelus australis TaxID=614101 RepID=A0ABQ9HKN1_9NEOP|nr:hypothetical protein PR048_016355 [Dryococelus australis]